MAKTYYSDYVNHCLKFYTRYQSRVTSKSKINEKNWIACDKVFSNLTEIEKETLFKIYQSDSNIKDAILNVCKEFNLDVNKVWSLVQEVEKLVARHRGLIE